MNRFALRKYLIINLYEPNYVHGLILILAVGMITYGKNAFTFTILGDEWAIINSIVFNDTVNCPSSNVFLRPLSGCWSSLLYHAFGLNVIAYHVATLILIVLRSILFFLVLDRIFPKWRLFNLTTALLFLVYPTSFHHLLFESGYQIISHIFFFLTCLLLIILYQSASWWAYFLAFVFLVLSLLLYEAHMGIMILVSVIFFVLSRGQSIYRRIGYLVPSLVVALFGIGRWLAQLQIGNAFGISSDSVTLVPRILLFRMIKGYATSLSMGLFNALRDFLDLYKYSHVTPTLILGGILMILLIVLGLVLINNFEPIEVTPRSEYIPTTFKQQFIIIISGLLAIGAGYLPMITVHSPNISFLPSRVNIIPTIGAVLVLSASFSMLIRLLNWKGKKAVFAFAVIITPFIILGCATQRSSQIESEIAWNQHKGMWQQMLMLAPDIAPDTHVLLILSGTKLGGRHMGTWAFDKALSVLYGHDDIVGQVAHGGYESLIYTGEGIEGEFDTFVPYEFAMLLVYDEENKELEYFQELPQDINISPFGILQCPDCILEQPTQRTERYIFVLE